MKSALLINPHYLAQTMELNRSISCDISSRYDIPRENISILYVLNDSIAISSNIFKTEALYNKTKALDGKMAIGSRTITTLDI